MNYTMKDKIFDNYYQDMTEEYLDELHAQEKYEIEKSIRLFDIDDYEIEESIEVAKNLISMAEDYALDTDSIYEQFEERNIKL